MLFMLRLRYRNRSQAAMGRCQDEELLTTCGCTVWYAHIRVAKHKQALSHYNWDGGTAAAVASGHQNIQMNIKLALETIFETIIGKQSKCAQGALTNGVVKFDFYFASELYRRST